ncbi:MAG TPA: hypothetical protein DCW68_01870 [Rhodospirillaceae bacterium]|nr:MAG: hypothetical protein A2018_04835 [Alphaproteobacteria bacterium GWF2_58_20]HAU28843.1 hypothetical protein [Rhodospirillaceae bacterium]
MKSRFLTLAILPILMAGSAFAQMPGNTENAPRKMPPILAEADLDKDGFLTLAEMQKQTEIRLAKMDTDKDGRVSMEEIRASAKHMRKGMKHEGRGKHGKNGKRHEGGSRKGNCPRTPPQDSHPSPK